MVNNTIGLRMKDDIMFKAFFSKKGHEEFLEDFIGSILGERVKVAQVVHDARLEQISKDEKYGVLDLDVELENGKKINLEMQIRDLYNIEKRTTFYAGKKISEQLGGENRYYKDLKNVIIIAILNYSFIPYEDYVNKTVRVLENHKEYKINNEVAYYYIELDKFRKKNPDMTDKLNQWLAFLDRERGDLLEMAKKENNLVNKADKEYNVLTGDAELRRLAEIRLMSDLEVNSALELAKAEGGKTKAIEIAKELLKMKIEIERIAQITGLSEEEIKKYIK
ncbi:MAG: Rpn family recombination-promoting nuclease/putative transposase [Clostridia bacterium]|nr:Rpn family recombination-promoting nuclease/putative transposase [Clostridia bacterium]